MNTTGSVDEDDLILYAMQALPTSEMETVASRLQQDPEMERRLAEIHLVLGTFAEAAVPIREVPTSALATFQQSMRSAEVTLAPLPLRASSVAKVSPWSNWLSWGGWALAACSLTIAALQFREVSRLDQRLASSNSALHASQAQATAAATERDRSSAALHEKSVEVEDSRQQASEAMDHSAALRAQVAGEKNRAQQEAGRAETLAASAQQSAAEQDRLRNELSRQEVVASQVQSSQQVLAAISDPTALRVTLTIPKQKKRPSGRGVYLASTGALVFTANDLNAAPAGKVYELWLMPTDGSAPVAAGTFTPDAAGNASVISARFRPQINAKGFAVTLEPAGGSSKPTLPILLAGNA